VVVGDLCLLGKCVSMLGCLGLQAPQLLRVRVLQARSEGARQSGLARGCLGGAGMVGGDRGECEDEEKKERRVGIPTRLLRSPLPTTP